MSVNRFRSIRLQLISENTLNLTSAATGEILLDSTNQTLRIYTSPTQSATLATRYWTDQRIAANSYILPTASTLVKGGVKVDGTSITIDGAGVISAIGGGGGGGYVLPTAGTGSGGTLGGVKVDGTSITIDGNGVISSSGGGGGYVLPTAGTGSGGTLGGVKVDGTTVTISGAGVISATPTPYTLPTASTLVLGGVKVDGTSITITNGVISGASTYTLPIAGVGSGGTLGGVKVDGTTITVNAQGIITGLAAVPYVLPTASTTVKGGVKIDGVTLAFNGSGQLYYTGSGVGGYILPVATAVTLGGVIVDNTTISVTESGVISVIPNPYVLPQASVSTLGGVKVDGTTITINVETGAISSAGAAYVLPTAGVGSGGDLGGVKVDGTTITIDGSGVISSAGGYSLPTATASTLGGVKIDNETITINNQVISVVTGTTTVKGVVRADGSTITVNSGILSAATQITTATNLQVNSLGVGTAASATTGEIRATNEVTAYYSSDSRLKENIVRIDNALELIKQINGVWYDWTDDYIQRRGGEDGYFVRKHDVGVIAQDVEKVVPQIVANRDDGFKAVKYERLAAVLIEAVKDLADEVDAIKEKLNALTP